jgi:hypothetical protein
MVVGGANENLVKLIRCSLNVLVKDQRQLSVKAADRNVMQVLVPEFTVCLIRLDITSTNTFTL